MQESLKTGQAAPTKQVPWIPILWFGGLLILLFFPVLTVMVKEWATDESMGHAFFVPVIAGYVIWQRRDSLLALPVKPHWTGYVLILLGFVFLIAGMLGAEFFVMRVGLLTCMLGILASLCGWTIIRAMAFPLFLLLFMIRIPLFIYSQLTFPLQLLASRVAEQSLLMLDIPVLRQGNVLELASQKLNVVEACSGIRSVLSLSFLSLVYGYFFETRLWIRILLFLATFPIAIAGNAMRVTLTGIFSEVNPELATGIYHTLEGWVIFLIAIFYLILFHTILKLFIKLVGRSSSPHVEANA